MRLLGHRGASADFPENTLEAFEGAVYQKADGIELDVMRCGSGELVVCHDEVLERLAGLQWEVAKTPWWKLRRVDVGSRLGFRPARIPLLHEVFDAVPSDFFVNIELKCDTLEDGGLSVEVGRFVNSHKHRERCFVSSFNPACLVRLARAYPTLQRGLLIDPEKSYFTQALVWLPIVGKTSVHPHHQSVTPERVNAWHERGLEVAVWTVDDPDEARGLRAMSVDWLITNRPGDMRNALSGTPRA